jgi:hypothetical protein
MKTLFKSKMFIFMLFLLGVFILSACAVRTPVKKVSIDEIKANQKYENVILRDFTAADGIIYPEVTLMECRGTAIDYLKTKNIFKVVEKESNKSFSEPTLFVDVKLTELRIVSGAARMWAGAMAGRSHMKIIAKLTDANGIVIAEQELFGAPNAMGSAYSMGGSDRGLAQNMGILLGDFILANVSGR